MSWMSWMDALTSSPIIVVEKCQKRNSIIAFSERVHKCAICLEGNCLLQSSKSVRWELIVDFIGIRG